MDDIGTEREKEKHRDYKEGRKKERKGIQIEMERILRREQEKKKRKESNGLGFKRMVLYSGCYGD